MNNYYQDLIIWQRSMDLVEEVYHLVKYLPNEEKFALSEQIRRAAVSIPLNIAEGRSRRTHKEWIHFLSIAAGSKSELETQLLICCRLGYLNENQIEKSMKYCDEISRMIYVLIHKPTK